MSMKAFATAFLGDQAKAIQKRIQDAEDYEDEQREKVERNKATIGKRRSLVNLAKTEINLLKKMGAKDKHINAAIAAGPKALFEFSQALQKEAQKRPSAGGSYTFSESELDAFIEMPEEFTTETMDPAEHYARSIGLAKPSLGSYEAKEQGFLKSALGMGLKDSVRSRLDKDAYYEGYSMMDINEVARQEAYESMAPGTYFSFKPSAAYNPVTVGPAFRDAYADAGEVSAAMDAELRRQYPAEDEYRAKKKEIIERQQAGVIDAYAQQFGRRFLEDTSINLQGQLGNELYTATYARHASLEDLERYIVDNLIGMKDIDVGSTIKVVDGDDRVVEITLGENNEVSSMTIDSRAVADDEVATLVASLQGAGLLSEASIKAAATPLPEGPPTPTETTKYIKNGEVVNGVPPRPNFGSRFTGLSLDYDTREKIRRGEMAIPERGLRVDEWDELFGDTHNPDGSRKEIPQETVDTEEEIQYTRANPYVFEESLDDDEVKKIFNSLPIGSYFINPADGRLKQK